MQSNTKEWAWRDDSFILISHGGMGRQEEDGNTVLLWEEKANWPKGENGEQKMSLLTMNPSNEKQWVKD